MPVTLHELYTNVRSQLDEETPRRWNEYELIQWINDGVKDIARRTESLQSYNANLVTLPSMSKLLLPADVIRVNRVEWKDGSSNNTYPLQAKSHQEMDQYWGTDHTTTSNTPSAYVLWGNPPKLTIQLWPIPSSYGTLILYYYRLPNPMKEWNDVADIPEGWDDLVVHYVEYRAKRKDRDQTWQEAKQLYEEDLNEMYEQTRFWHDQNTSIFVGPRAVPSWLYEFDD